MEHEEFKQLLLKLMALADRMEQRDARVIQQLAQQVSGLQRAVQGVSAGGEQFAKEALNVLRSQGREAVQAGMGDAAARCQEDLMRVSAEAGRTSDEVRASADALRRQRGLWLWAAPLALIVGSMLAIAAATYAVASSRKQVERHQIEAALLRAYNQADVTLCGERLCANVDDKGQRYGDHKQYLPIKPR